MNYLKIICAIGCLLGLAGPLTAAPATSALPERPLVTVDPQAHYRVVYDIHSGELAAGVSRGLYYARGLIEAYQKQGVKPKQLDIHLVLHGDAAKFLLIEETYRQAINDPFAVNLNAKIAQELLNLEVSVEICHSTMRSMGWVMSDVLPGVTIVHDGYTRLIELQNGGYAYIGGF
ncbi:MAG TPA: DsrE family protein [Thiohalobacter sp.]|nr:DsrE family protein [Thiohalobacter sp.]